MTFCRVCARELRETDPEGWAKRSGGKNAAPKRVAHPEAEDMDIEHVDVFFCGPECGRVFFLTSSIDRLAEALRERRDEG